VKKEVIPFFKAITSYTANKYYGVSKRMIIIRAPAIFRMVWRIAKNFYRAEVQKKMIFASKDYLNVLEQYMDTAVLPPCINPQGTGVTARGFPPRLEGGSIPEDLDYDNVSKASDTQCMYSKNGSGSFDTTSSSDGDYSDEPSDVSVACKKLLKGTFSIDEQSISITSL
jgi:hypothetical protein